MGSALTGWLVPQSNCSSPAETETESLSMSLYVSGPFTYGTLSGLFLCSLLDQKLLFTLQSSHQMPISQRLSPTYFRNFQVHAVIYAYTAHSLPTSTNIYVLLSSLPHYCFHPSSFRDSWWPLQGGPGCLLRTEKQTWGVAALHELLIYRGKWIRNALA